MKYFKIENFVKGIFLSILGLAVMTLAVYGWWTDQLTNIEAGAVLCIGFALAFMRTKLDDLVTAFFRKFFGIESKKKEE